MTIPLRQAADKNAECVVCGALFRYRVGAKPKYCGPACRKQAYQHKYRRTVDPVVDKGFLGEAAELIVAADLMRRGIVVFQNVARTGPADLVAWVPGRHEVAFIDVKGVTAAYVRADGTTAPYQGIFFDETRKVWIVDG